MRHYRQVPISSCVVVPCVFMPTPNLPCASALTYSQLASNPCSAGLLPSRDYLYQDCLYGLEGRPVLNAASHMQQEEQPGGGAEGVTGEDSDAPAVHHGPQWAFLRFSHPVTAPADSLVIGSRLDTDLQLASCR